jgi:hypothetical protein
MNLRREANRATPQCLCEPFTLINSVTGTVSANKLA